MPEPEPQTAQLVVDAQVLPEQAAEDHHCQCTEESVHAGFLATRLLATHPGRQEKAAAYPGRSDPEDRELEVPGAHQRVGQEPSEVEAVEASRLHAVVGKRASQERLRQEEERHHGKEPPGGPLARRQFESRGSGVRGVGGIALHPSSPDSQTCRP